jgi:hypothetical protein
MTPRGSKKGDTVSVLQSGGKEEREYSHHERRRREGIYN